MNSKLLIAAAMAALSSPEWGETFSGRKKCPACGKPTMTGTVCDLRCAVALKHKTEATK